MILVFMHTQADCTLTEEKLNRGMEQSKWYGKGEGRHTTLKLPKSRTEDPLKSSAA
jgi:hypothetical protein